MVLAPSPEEARIVHVLDEAPGGAAAVIYSRCKCKPMVSLVASYKKQKSLYLCGSSPNPSMLQAVFRKNRVNNHILVRDIYFVVGIEN